MLFSQMAGVSGLCSARGWCIHVDACLSFEERNTCMLPAEYRGVAYMRVCASSAW